MRRERWTWLGVGLFFVLLALLTFRCAWGADVTIASSDVNLGGLAFRKQMGWDLFSGFFSGRPLFGYANYSISFFNFLVQLIPIHSFLEWFYAGVLMFGSLAMVWFLRLWSLRWSASIVGALVGFWVNSILLASAGHVYKMEVLAFSMVSLVFIEKGVRAVSARGQIGYGLLAGVSVGLMMLEQQDVALLAGLFLAPYAFLRLIQVKMGWARSALFLGLLSVVGLLLSGPVLLKSYDQNIRQAASVQGEKSAKWDYITQWSLVPGEWPDLIAMGWSGWSSFDSKAPYWGRVGQTADYPKTGEGFRNFRLESNYVGLMPFLLAVFGVASVCRRGSCTHRGMVLFWGGAAVIALGLAMGRYSWLYEGFFQIPIFNNIRAPIKFLDNMQIALGILAGFGVDALYNSSSSPRFRRGAWISCAGVAICILLGLWGVSLFEEGWRTQITEAGFAAQVEVLLERMRGAWWHAFVCALVGLASVILCVKRRWHLAVCLLIGLLSIDSLLLTSRYFKANSVKAVSAPHAVLDQLAQRQGAERVAFVDQNGIYNNWLALQGGTRDLNFFNIWQMNRMPVVYEELLGALESNPIRLWQLASVRYMTMPERVYQSFKKQTQMMEWFTPLMSYQIPTSAGKRRDVMVEFMPSIPRLALFRNWTSMPIDAQLDPLADPAYNPRQQVLVDHQAALGSVQGNPAVEAVEPTEITRSRVRVEVQLEEPVMLRFSQRIQPGWQVFVNGKEQPLLTMDYLVMGVNLEAGHQVVEFRAPQNRAALYILGLGFVACVSGGVLVSRKS
ncbi:MAG: hypothetical protein ACJZ86_03740 [Pontiellaceae bacterium]